MAKDKKDKKIAKKERDLPEGPRLAVIELLKKAYNMELETVCNYVSNSIHLDGMLASEIKESLEEDVTEELGHAQTLARRIKVLGGKIPGSQAFRMEQTTLQPPDDTLDILSVINGVIDAEEAAIDHYQKIIEATDEIDPVTQDIVTEIKGDEEEHLREFRGFLREYDAMKRMFR